MQDKFTEYIIKAVNDVFTTMIFLNPKPQNPIIRNNGTEIPSQKDISGIMGLSGNLTASIVIHFEKILAVKATSNMLGIELTEIGNDVKDAVGEITNMISGAVKSEFMKSGIEMNLSLPIVVTGKDFQTDSLNGNGSVIIPFEIDDNRFYIEFSYKK